MEVLTKSQSVLFRSTAFRMTVLHASTQSETAWGRLPLAWVKVAAKLSKRGITSNGAGMVFPFTALFVQRTTALSGGRHWLRRLVAYAASAGRMDNFCPWTGTAWAVVLIPSFAGFTT